MHGCRLRAETGGRGEKPTFPAAARGALCVHRQPREWPKVGREKCVVAATLIRHEVIAWEGCGQQGLPHGSGRHEPGVYPHALCREVNAAVCLTRMSLYRPQDYITAGLVCIGVTYIKANVGASYLIASLALSSNSRRAICIGDVHDSAGVEARSPSSCMNVASGRANSMVHPLHRKDGHNECIISGGQSS